MEVYVETSDVSEVGKRTRLSAIKTISKPEVTTTDYETLSRKKRCDTSFPAPFSPSAAVGHPLE